MRQGRKVPQAKFLVARDGVGLAYRGKYFGLLDGINPEIGFEIQVKVQHVWWVTRLLSDEPENSLPDYVGLRRFCKSGGNGRCRRNYRCGNHWCCPDFVHNFVRSGSTILDAECAGNDLQFSSGVPCDSRHPSIPLGG